MREIEYRAPATPEELDAAFALREQVFMKEEGRHRDIETDEYDAVCQHFVGVQNGEVIAVLRCYEPERIEGSVKIGRVAVKKELRGQGIGREMMLTAHAWAALHYQKVYLHAQAGVQNFYLKLGYASVGEEFMESGTPHIYMWRELPAFSAPKANVPAAISEQA